MLEPVWDPVLQLVSASCKRGSKRQAGNVKVISGRKPNFNNFEALSIGQVTEVGLLVLGSQFS